WSDTSVLLYICLLERRANIGHYVGVVPGLLFAPSSIRHFRRHVGDQRPIGGGQEILICVRIGSEPIGEVGSHTFLAQKVWIGLLDEIQPALHRIPAPLDDLPVAVLQPGSVRNNYSRISPTRSSNHALAPRGRACRSFALEGKHVGRHVGKRALRRLRIHHVVHPFVRKALNVKVVSSRAPEDTGIAHPAEALVALWTVGRNAQKISPLSP